MKTLTTYLNEASIGRVYQHTKDRNIGIITAHRGEYPAAENYLRNKALERDIQSHGFGYIPVKGRYVEGHGTDEAHPVDERSFVVVGSKGNDNGELERFLRKHGEKYEQDSILHKRFDEGTANLIGTKKDVPAEQWPQYGEKGSVGSWHPDRTPMFHSVLYGRHRIKGPDDKMVLGPHKHTFAFESFQFVNPPSFFHREETDF